MSRQEMLLWVNDCLQAEFSKIEQLHTGAGYCLFTDLLFPGSMQLKRVKWNSRSELDWLSNWKILQTTWKQLGIDKIVSVEKLIKGKFQDNFEFLQWFKKFFDANYDGHEYNPLEARNFEELPKENKIKAAGALRQPQPKASPKSYAAAPTQRVGSNLSVNSSGGTNRKPSGTSATPHQSTKQPAASAVSARQTTQPQQRPNYNGTAQQQTPQIQGVDPKIFEELKHELEEVRQQLAESDDVVAGLEKERDFYFTKLRKIEVVCQDDEPAGVIQVPKLLQILYETEEGFAPPEEAEEGSAAALLNNEEAEN